MSQQVNDNFDLLAGIPLDDRYRHETISSRDNIPSTKRYTGLPAFVEQTDTLYILIGGIENTNWVAINGAGGTAGVETYLVEGYPFIWRKGFGNEDNSMEVGDVIMSGQCNYDDGSGSKQTFVKYAVYVSGDPSFIASYDVIEYIQ